MTRGAGDEGLAVRCERERVRETRAELQAEAAGSRGSAKPLRFDFQEIPVFIAILDLRTTPADRSTALAQLDSEREEIRAMPGNLDFRVYAARDDEEAVTVVHEWADEPSFAGYLASGAFTRSGAALRPLVTSAPVSRRFDAALVETV